MILLLSVLLQADGVKFPDEETWAAVAEKSKEHARIVEAYLDRDLWARAFDAVEERYGLRRHDLKIELAFVALGDDQRLARTRTADGVSHFEINMDAMAPYLKEIDKYDKAVEAGRSLSIVEPVRAIGTLTHELVHVYQHQGKMKKVPAWLFEGMAAYAEPTDSHVRTFVYNGRKVEPLSAEIAEEDAYGRGWLYFKWLHKEIKSAKLKTFVARVIGGEDYRDVAAELTGKKWEAIVEAEARASAALAEIFAAKLGK